MAWSDAARAAAAEARRRHKGKGKLQGRPSGHAQRSKVVGHIPIQKEYAHVPPSERKFHMYLPKK